MIEKQSLQWVIEQHYRSIDRHYNQRVTTKSWCLTVWLGTVLASGFDHFEPNIGIAYTFLPIILFWLLEAFQASHMKILELRVTELEKLWTNGESKIKNRSDILFYGSHQFQSSKIKLNLFGFALFKMETVISFYFLLFGLNICIVTIRLAST